MSISMTGRMLRGCVQRALSVPATLYMSITMPMDMPHIHLRTGGLWLGHLILCNF